MKQHVVLSLSMLMIFLHHEAIHSDEATAKKDNHKERSPQNSMVSTKDRMWPSTTIPYLVEPGICQEINEAIKKGLALIENNTCIRFRRRVAPNEHHIAFTKFDASSGFVGYNQKSVCQRILLTEEMPDLVRRTTREVFHVLGRYHEHRRPDRDYYVRVIWDNIPLEFRSKYEKLDHITTQNVPYDYHSIMHFKPRYHPITRSPMMVSLTHSVDTSEFGSARLPTEHDYLHINLLYCEPTVHMVKALQVVPGINSFDIVWSPAKLLPLSYKIEVICWLVFSAVVYRKQTYEADPLDMSIYITDVIPGSRCVYTFFAVYNPISVDEGITNTVFVGTEPSTIPTGVRIKVRSATAAVVKWNKLQSYEREAVDGFDVSFKALHKLVPSDQVVHTTYGKLSNTVAVIRRLTPETTYELRVAATNEKGRGPFSPPITLKTRKL